MSGRSKESSIEALRRRAPSVGASLRLNPLADLEKLALDEVIANSWLSDKQNFLGRLDREDQDVGDHPIAGDRAASHHSTLVSSERAAVTKARQELHSLQSKIKVSDASTNPKESVQAHG